MLLNSHDLHTLLRPHERDVIDARPRLLAAVPPDFQPKNRLVDLEHACMRDTTPTEDVVLAPNGDGDDYVLKLLVPASDQSVDGHARATALESAHLEHRIPNEQVQGPGIAPWGQTDYMAALHTLAASMDMPVDTCAYRFGGATLRYDKDSGTKWRFHPALGFTAWTG